MIYQILMILFFFTFLLFILVFTSIIFKVSLWTKNLFFFKSLSIFWFILYGLFFIFLTGPENLSLYPAPEKSLYLLPWKKGVTRFVAQGNRSFVSHRGFHKYAWDFVMPVGTKILASRSGVVTEIEDGFDGIGRAANYIIITHKDKTHGAYAHIKFKGSIVKIGDFVKQGEPIAYSGMVGQTIFPHLHFYVINKEGTSSIPVSFKDVPKGVPLAGKFYTSKNG